MSEEFNNEQNSENIENTENTVTVEKENGEQQSAETKEKHEKILKLILIVIAVFLGTFAAVYTVVDMSMYRLGMRPFKHAANEINRMIDRDVKFIDKFEREERKAQRHAPVKIETQNDRYVVNIDLKAFDNNPENVKVKITENGLKIKGISQINRKGEMQEKTFFQNVIFPNRIDEGQVEKNVQGSKMTVIIPFDNDNRGENE